MIINEDIYKCPKCKELYFFNTAKKPYTTNCNKCKCGLIYLDNADRDTEPKTDNRPPYDPTKDSNSPYYIPVIECPYCHSTNTSKITNTSKAVHTAFFGIFSMSRNSKNYHCNGCGSDF